MIGLIFTLTCIFNLRGGLISVNKTQLLKNKFWNGSQEPSKTRQGFLHSVSVSVEDGSGLYDSDNYYFETCHYIQTTDHRYIVASDRLIKDINLHLESLKENKSFMRFTFLFTDEPIKNGESYDKYVGEKQFYTNFEPFEKMTENGKNDLKYDDILMHVYIIEDIISDLVFKDLIMLNEYISDAGKITSKDNFGEIEEKANFSLYFFKNYSDCLNCLKEFVKVFCHITLVKDSDSESINNEANTIKESQFMNQLNEKFNNILQYTDNNNSVGKEQCKILKQCFDMCSYHLKNMILANNTAFPIGCGYDMNYYITELCKHIYKSFKSCQIKYDLCDQNNIFLIVKEMNDLIDYYLVMLLVLAVKDLCFPEYVNNHFVKMIGKEIETLEDYITVEKAVCDYHNMFVYISNLALKKEDEMGELLPYFHPISNENYNCKIVDGIEIKFEHPAKFGQINGFDEEENEIVLVKDIDYFIEEFDKVYLISEILKMKKITEIEIISPISFFNKRFKVNKYLN